MNSKQGSRHIKRRMGNDLKKQILIHNGIISEDEVQRKPSVLACPRCNPVNAIDNKQCSKCSYPLTPSAFDEIKAAENDRIKAMEEKYEQDMKAIREDMENKFEQILTRIDINKII